jgi:L-iditol 2-dehydrogenase
MNLGGNKLSDNTKVARLHNIGEVQVQSEPMPVPTAGESLVRVTAVTLCGSDLHWFAEGGIGDARLKSPLVLGHEFAGVVESGELRGQRVAVDPAISCGKCEFCLEGNPNFCPSVRFAGDGVYDGALREHIAWPNHCLFPLPASLSDVDGAMLEPLGVAIHSVDLGHLKPGMSVGVFGCGPIGLLTLQVARAAGATRMIATDKLPHRLDAARELGAEVFEAADGQESAAILAATGGRGVDVAFEAAGENAAVETAVTVAKRGGHVVLIGIPADDETSFNASTARRKGLTIRLVRRMKNTYPRAIHLVESGVVDVRSLVTHRFPLAEIDKAFALASRREGIKVAVEL